MTALAILASLILLWDIVMAGHVAQLRSAPRPLAALSGLAALLAVPAFVIAVATNLGLDGRSVAGVAWIWPATIAIFAAHAIYSTSRRLTSPLVGSCISVYNLLLLAIATARYIGDAGLALPDWGLAVIGAHATALGVIAGPPALTSAYAVMLPIIAPVNFGHWRLIRPLGVLAATISLSGIAAIVAEIPAAAEAVESYERYDDAPIHDRPEDDFTIGVRVLAPLDASPPLVSLRNDLALVDTTRAEAVSLIVDPAGADAVALDSLARALEPFRRDSLTVIVALGMRAEQLDRPRPESRAFDMSRLESLSHIAGRLHPAYLLPADEPCASSGAGGGGGRFLSPSGSNISPPPLVRFMQLTRKSRSQYLYPLTGPRTARFTRGRRGLHHR